MKKWLILVLVVILIVPVLFLATGLILQSLVTDSGKQKLTAALGEAAGVPVSVGAAQFDLAQWFKFKPAVSLTDIRIGNPPGFRPGTLLDARKLAAQVALWPLIHREIQVRSIEVQKPRIQVQQNAQGATNIETLIQKLTAGPKSQSTTKLSIDEFRVSDGAIQAEGVRLHNIDLQVQGFAPDQASRLKLSAGLFNGTQSKMEVEGSAGPFAAAALPLNGTLTLNLAPDEIPAKLRAEQFGKLLGAPGSKARMRLEATVKGDLYRTISGPARLKLSDLMVGQDEKHLVPLSGEAPLRFSATQLMSRPDIQLHVPSAALKLGKGEWRGGADLRMRGALLSGASKGSIRDVDINEMLSSFTSSGGKIYGALAVPDYTLKFSGRNATEIQRSLDGNAKLAVKQGKVAALDLLAGIQRGLEQPQQDAAASGATTFASLNADMNLVPAGIDVSSLAMESQALSATGKGLIGHDQSLNFALDTRVTGAAARLVNRLTRQPEAESATIPVTVTGTVDSPRVRPSAKKLATGMVKGLLDSFLKKK